MIESHPDNALEDLRLYQPFAEFKNHIQSYDLDSMDKKVCTLGSAHLSVVISQFKLCQFYTADSSPLHSLFNPQDHSHTPWIIIVAKHLEKWLSEVPYIFCAKTNSPSLILMPDYFCWCFCTIKRHSTFVVVAQLSATEKLQGERGL